MADTYDHVLVSGEGYLATIVEDDVLIGKRPYESVTLGITGLWFAGGEGEYDG
jgi:hypothetical protein